MLYAVFCVVYCVQNVHVSYCVMCVLYVLCTCSVLVPTHCTVKFSIPVRHIISPPQSLMMSKHRQTCNCIIFYFGLLS